MQASDALLAIQELMDGVEWTPDTLDQIADILRDAGYRVRDLNEELQAEREQEAFYEEQIRQHGR